MLLVFYRNTKYVPTCMLYIYVVNISNFHAYFLTGYVPTLYNIVF